MPFDEGGGSSSTFGHEPDAELRALEISLHDQYGTSPAAHEVHRHLEQAFEDIDAHEPVLPGFEPFAGRKEYAGLLHVSEQLLVQYETITRKYGRDFNDIKDTLEWAHLHTATSKFDHELVEVARNQTSIQDTDALLKAVFTLQGEAEAFSGGNEALTVAGAPSIDGLIASRAIPGPHLKEVYWAKPEVVSRHHSGKSFLANIASSDFLGVKSRAAVAKAAYDGELPLDTIREGEDPVVDRLRHEVGQYQLMEYELHHARPKELTPEGIAKYETQTRQRASFLIERTGISKSAATKYMQALLNRALVHSEDEENPTPSYISGALMYDQLIYTKQLTRKVTPELMGVLSEDLGVVNFDRYNETIIDNMKSLIGNDAAAFEKRGEMQEQGVTVVFTAAYSDHNNAFGEIGEMYSQQDSHTLLFEVAQPSDFYRRLLLLQKHGIKATTIVIAAHGLPGETVFSDGVNTFYLFSETRQRLNPQKKHVDVHVDGANLERIVGDEFMMDDEHGERRVILHNCSSAEEREGEVSIAQTFAARAKRLNLRVIGASDVMVGGRTEDTGKVRFADYEEMKTLKKSHAEAKSLGVELSFGPLEVAQSRKDQIMTKIGLKAVEPPQLGIKKRPIEEFEPVRKASTLRERTDERV